MNDHSTSKQAHTATSLTRVTKHRSVPVKPAIVYGDLTGEWPSSATGLGSFTCTVTLSSLIVSGVEFAVSTSAESDLTASDATEFGGGVGATGDSARGAASGSLSPTSASTEMETPNTERKR